MPLRQWVCSLPWELRLKMGYDGAPCSAVTGAFVEEVQRSYRWRASALPCFELHYETHRTPWPVA